ncbi:MAG: response regulator transcription factor [Bradyrhizobium sp.]
MDWIRNVWGGRRPFRGGVSRGETTIRILLVEDEAIFAQRIRVSLAEAGFDADHAADGAKGWLLGSTERYDAAILDLGLPNVSGLNVLKRWRSEGHNLPVLILSGRSGWAERVSGLNAGADDYLEKPCHAQELVARLRSLLRRSSGKADVVRQRDLEVNAAAGTVTKSGEPIELTALELRMLDHMMRHADRIVTQNELLDHIYSVNHGRDSNVVEVYVARLRKKLGRDAIRTIRGMGYRIG